MKSIAFCPQLVPTIISGKKTMTRRVVKEVPTYIHNGRPIMDWGLSGVWDDDDGRWWLDVQTDVDDNSTEELICPYQPGELRWIREHHWKWGRWKKDGLTPTGRDKFRFEAGGENYLRFDKPEVTAKRDGSVGWVFRNSRYMLESDARVVIKIGDSRVERLQEISEEDAIAEGMQPVMRSQDFDPAAEQFANLWDKLNGDRGYGWEANPFVRVINFELHQIRDY